MSTTLPDKIPISTLARIGDLTERRIRQLVETGALPAGNRGMFPCEETLARLVAHYREQAGDNGEELLKERLRKARADADSAEIEAAKQKGEIMLVEDQEQAWADRIIACRRKLDGATWLSEQDRERVVALLLSVEPENL